MSLDPDELDRLTLHLVPNLGPQRLAALLGHFGSAAAVLRATPGQLREAPQVGPKLAQAFYQAMRAGLVEKELELIDKFRVRLLFRGRPGYPEALDNISDPPSALYYRGSLLEADAKAIALVGTRQCTPYGLRTAQQLAAGLARAGYTVVSGLARGIDAAAHRGALEAGGRTLAVMAGGLSRVYPPEHVELARQVEAAGALVAEMPMRQEPLPSLFPRRNRIISGLSRGVVIIEAGKKSGALITAEIAADDHNRPVFAVPGPVDSPASDGTADLLRKGAVLTHGVDDILEEFGEKPTPRVAALPAKTLGQVQPSVQVPLPAPARPAGPPPGLDDTQRRLWELLSEPRAIDTLAERLALPVAQVSGILLLLEIKKVVRRLPGSVFARSG